MSDDSIQLCDLFAIQRDANRYRWLRLLAGDPVKGLEHDPESPEDLDTLIDAAMAKEGL